METQATDVCETLVWIPILILGTCAFFMMFIGITGSESKIWHHIENLFDAFVRKNWRFKRDAMVERMIRRCYDCPSDVSFHLGELKNVYFHYNDLKPFGRLIYRHGRFSYIRTHRGLGMPAYGEVDSAYNFYLLRALKYAMKNGGQATYTPTTLEPWDL